MIAKSFDLVRYVGYFFQKLKVGGIYGSSTVDQQPKNVACQLMYGNMLRIPVPDIDRTDFMLLMGGNPSVSKGSIFSHRDVMGAIRPLRARGGRRSEEHTSELQSLMRISYAVFCLHKKKQ